VNAQNAVVVIPLPGNDSLGQALAAELGATAGTLAVHRFPDGETSVRVTSPVAGSDVILAATLDHPNDKLVTLYLAAQTLRGLQARRVLLVAPYLPYMRQDRSFRPGEGVSAVHIASWMSGFVDGLVTVDPHLHRIHRLDEVFRVPTRVVQSAVPIARWIRTNISRPVVIGPDGESRQWVSAVARAVACPYFVMDKVRHGDRDVEVRLPDREALEDRTPVLLDDIVSSGGTMQAAIRCLGAAGFAAPYCISVHALLSDQALEQLKESGAQGFASCNTVVHSSNRIDLHHPLAFAARELLREGPAA